MTVQDISIPKSAIALADNTTLEASGGKLQIKDGGVNSAKIEDNSIASADLSFTAFNINQIYEGTGFNTHGAAGTDEQSHELTAISSGDLTNATYLLIEILGTFITSGSAGETSSVELKIQSKETGGAYADDMTYKKMAGIEQSADALDETNSGTLSYIHTLTAGEKTNGVQIKLFSKSIANGNAWFNNIQTRLSII